jgi:hypothetical protein
MSSVSVTRSWNRSKSSASCGVSVLVNLWVPGHVHNECPKGLRCFATIFLALSTAGSSPAQQQEELLWCPVACLNNMARLPGLAPGTATSICG